MVELFRPYLEYSVGSFLLTVTKYLPGRIILVHFHGGEGMVACFCDSWELLGNTEVGPELGGDV